MTEIQAYNMHEYINKIKDAVKDTDKTLELVQEIAMILHNLEIDDLKKLAKEGIIKLQNRYTNDMGTKRKAIVSFLNDGYKLGIIIERQEEKVGEEETEMPEETLGIVADGSGKVSRVDYINPLVQDLMFFQEYKLMQEKAEELSPKINKKPYGIKESIENFMATIKGFFFENQTDEYLLDKMELAGIIDELRIIAGERVAKYYEASVEAIRRNIKRTNNWGRLKKIENTTPEQDAEYIRRRSEIKMTTNPNINKSQHKNTKEDEDQR